MGIEAAFAQATSRLGIPAAIGVVANGEKILWSAVAGHRHVAAGVALEFDDIFRLYSMTKPLTTVAALQLVEERKLHLDEPVSRQLPDLERVLVLEGFSAESGEPRLRRPGRAITARHLLTHTAGFGYEFWNEEIRQFAAATGGGGLASLRAGDLISPLLFDPGERWQYGISTDWLGRLVEELSGMSLGEYFQRRILAPLGMKDTGFRVPEEKHARIVSTHWRQSDGAWEEAAPAAPAPHYESGGGGLSSTASDYVRFLQMLLRGGDGLLRRESIQQMEANQIGAHTAGRMATSQTDWASAVDFRPGVEHKFGFGMQINSEAYETGRPAGTAGWAGLANTYFWIDRASGNCAILMMQLLPFFDPAAVGMLHEFERMVYGGEMSE